MKPDSPPRPTPTTGHGRARGLVSKPSGDQIRSASHAPSAALAPLVAAYWSGVWDLRGHPPHVTELLGDPCVHFVFERGGGPHPEARLVGVWTRLWKRKLEGVARATTTTPRRSP